MTYTTKQGQTPYDIALQVYGSVEYVAEIAKHLPSLTRPIPANTVLVLDNIETNDITRFFINRKPIANEHFSGGFPYTLPFILE